MIIKLCDKRRKKLSDCVLVREETGNVSLLSGCVHRPILVHNVSTNTKSWVDAQASKAFQTTTLQTYHPVIESR